MTEKLNKLLTELQDEFKTAQQDAAPTVTTAAPVTATGSTSVPPPVPLKPGEEGPSVIPPFSGHVRIGVNRFGYGETSTCSIFLMNAYDNDGNLIDSASGYFLEPGYDLERNTIAGSDTAIPSGEYTVVPAYFHQKSGYFEITNVSGRSAILLHPGNKGKHTAGCFLPGSSYSYDPRTNEYTVLESTKSMDALREFIIKYGSGFATIAVSM